MGVIHLITPEYPPHLGGVASYTRQLAAGLTDAGEQVHVWCPWGEIGQGFTVHPVLGEFRPMDLERAGAFLDDFAPPRRIIVQWVPHGYGRRSMNVRFCLWLRNRAARGDRVELIVHEPYLSLWEGSWRQTGAALVHRLMTVILLRCASAVWISAPLWEHMWRPYALGRKVSFVWLPIPSALCQPDAGDVGALRAVLGGPALSIVGHFGTYGRPVATILERVLPELLEQSDSVHVLLIGNGSDRFLASFSQRHPLLAGRMTASGPLTESSLAAHVAACDVLLQPYPDGVSSRRTTVMAGLRLGVPIVTTAGYVTESLWKSNDAVRLVPIERAINMVPAVLDLLSSSDRREQLGRAGHDLYERTFTIERTIAALTSMRQGKAA
jgi:glycosyltransferase involved in cell wall biosynthesis